MLKNFSDSNDNQNVVMIAPIEIIMRSADSRNEFPRLRWFAKSNPEIASKASVHTKATLTPTSLEAKSIMMG